MAAAHVVSTGAAGVGPVTSVTTPAVNTTGASHLAVSYARDNTAAPVATPISDSKTNTWSASIAEQANAGVDRLVRQFQAVNPTVGTSHTFTVTLEGAGFPTIAASASSSMDTTTPLDKTASGSDGTSPYNSPNTATLAQADEFVVGLWTWILSLNNPTSGASFTTGFLHEGSGSEMPILQQWKVVAATTAVQSHVTADNDGDSANICCTYKGAVAVASTADRGLPDVKPHYTKTFGAGGLRE